MLITLHLWEVMHYLTSKDLGRFPLPQGNLDFAVKILMAEEIPQHYTDAQCIPLLPSVSHQMQKCVPEGSWCCEDAQGTASLLLRRGLQWGCGGAAGLGWMDGPVTRARQRAAPAGHRDTLHTATHYCARGITEYRDSLHTATHWTQGLSEYRDSLHTGTYCHCAPRHPPGQGSGAGCQEEALGTGSIKPPVVSAESLSSSHTTEDENARLRAVIQKDSQAVCLTKEFLNWFELQPAQLLVLLPLPQSMPMSMSSQPGTCHPSAAALENTWVIPGVHHTSGYTHKVHCECWFLIWSTKYRIKRILN